MNSNISISWADGEFDRLLMEYIGLLTHVAHDDGEQLVGIDLSGKGVRQ